MYMKYLKMILLLLSLPLCLFSKEYALYYNVGDSLRIGITGAPYASYSSEKGVNIGLSVFLFEKNSSKQIIPGQDFKLRLDGDFTFEDEKSFYIGGNIPLRSKNHRINVDLRYKTSPQDFFGIGANTDKNNIISFTKEYYKFTGNWLKQYSDNRSYGLAWDISGYKNNDFDSLKTDIKINGFDNFYRTTGLGLVFVYNSKTPNNFPKSGFFYKNQFMIYDKKINSDYDFLTLKQEFHYFHLIDNHIIANQIVSENTFNNVPFHYYTEQGSSTLMRGYKTGRFLEKHFIGAQTEYRSPFIFWRVSGVAFLSSGFSYKSSSDLNNNNLHFAGGFGFRFALDKEERVNLRADIGFSNEGKQIYFKFGESF